LYRRAEEKGRHEITENKSRKIKEFKSKAESALWFAESYGLVRQYLKLESTDGQTVKVDFNPSYIPRFALMYRIISISTLTYAPGIFPGIFYKII
jgi:hypothetical protein